MRTTILICCVFSLLLTLQHNKCQVSGFYHSYKQFICNHNRRYASSSFNLNDAKKPIPLSNTNNSSMIDIQAGIVDKDYFNRKGVWDERDLGSLLNANRAWAQRMVTGNPDFFEEHKKGHAPKILWIGCSDARVPANEMIGEPPGSVFVHRNIANMVVNTDFNCMSVIQYAVDVLQVKHIIVCGHYDCGGIRAALTNVDHRSPLENWLRNIRDTYRLHKDELNEINDSRLRQRRLVELNVIEQCLNIFKTAVVQRRRVKTHMLSKQDDSEFEFSQPRVHAFVYEPTTGKASKLRVDFGAYLKDLRSVYDLYQVPTTPADDLTV